MYIYLPGLEPCTWGFAGYQDNSMFAPIGIDDRESPKTPKLARSAISSLGAVGSMAWRARLSWPPSILTALYDAGLQWIRPWLVHTKAKQDLTRGLPVGSLDPYLTVPLLVVEGAYLTMPVCVEWREEVCTFHVKNTPWQLLITDRHQWKEPTNARSLGFSFSGPHSISRAGQQLEPEPGNLSFRANLTYWSATDDIHIHTPLILNPAECPPSHAALGIVHSASLTGQSRIAAAQTVVACTSARFSFRIWQSGLVRRSQET
ncbi:hypothetical protein B0T24DRAFT_343853 [Lasiosphaeria ovina]|uniref:Uncharacterized protein n=1 Tax=Lasiosphaeria ovina TaxID=92902 RepID=A0AAE0K2R9_9PEZI|nr:hypothetical protein B0T24DRAFT_343853 [Lasiosphaeria ovina]